MGLLDILFGNRPKVKIEAEQTFKMLNGYSPKFTTWRGSIYEAQLVRAAVNTLATHTGKLHMEFEGSARPTLINRLKHAPNQFQTWSQFLTRIRTLYEVYNTVFIAPVYDDLGEVSGIYTPLPTRCEIVQAKIQGKDIPFLRYEFGWGQHASMELANCGILPKFQLKSDFFGENNESLLPTMELIHIQNEGIQEGVKSAAAYRFMARVNNFTKADDLASERQSFTEKNFGRDAKGGGLLLFPNTYVDVKQLDTKPWVVDSEQMKIINESVFQYFGVNEEVVENKAYGDAWTAFYEGAIEPFAIQLSEVLTKMLFTLRERSQGNMVMATANRLQYLSNTEKLNVSSQLLDRGIISINDARQIWNLPPVEGGNARIIRGEYYNADEKVTEVDDGNKDNNEDRSKETSTEEIRSEAEEGETSGGVLHDEESLQGSDTIDQVTAD